MKQLRKICYLTMLLNLMVMTGYAVALPLSGAVAEETSAVTEQPSAAESRTVVARVNGTPIYEEQLKPTVEKSLAGYRRYGAQRDNPELVKRLQTKALDRLIGDMLINQEAKKHTIDNLEELVEQRVKALEKKFEMERYLKLRHLTMEQLREGLKERVRLDEYLKAQGVLEPEIPEERIRKIYEEDPGSFSRKETVEVSHVLIAVAADAGAEQKEQARQKAERIRKEILEGTDFVEMAKAHSDCNSAAGGGVLEPIKRGYMPPEFDEVAFALEKDAISEVVETKFGYHIVKVLDKHAGGVVPYEEMRGFLLKYLQEAESKKKLASHAAELKGKAEIEILLK